jgi:hypothetical protein
VLGTLNDSGSSGDAVAGDKVYSIRQRIQAAVIAPMRLQVTWALKGVLKRSASNTVSILVTVVRLPSDPGDAGKQTLAGIDSDGDGVRDDVQRYIALTYPSSAKTRLALSQQAKSILDLVASSNTTDMSVLTDRLIRSLECLSAARPDTFTTLELQLRGQILNTSDRYRRYLAAQSAAAGSTLDLRSPSEASSSCSFDLTGMPN